MGDPRKLRRKWKSLKHPWRKDVLEADLALIGRYGLRNKRELLVAKTMLSSFRGQARRLLSHTGLGKGEEQGRLIGKLHRLGILQEKAGLDDVLSLKVEDILERRLQTIVHRKGLAKTMAQARQLITHGHIAINERQVYVPGYLVSSMEEGGVDIASTSPLKLKQVPIKPQATNSIVKAGR